MADYFLFPHLKSLLRGWQFARIEEMQVETRRLLLNIDCELLKKAFLELPKRWLKCVKSGGEYFEAHHVDVQDKFDELDIASSSEEESGNESEVTDDDYESEAY